jgi:hypothetical protein
MAAPEKTADGAECWSTRPGLTPSTGWNGPMLRAESNSIVAGADWRRLIGETENRLFTDRRIWLYGAGAALAYAISLVVRSLQYRWFFARQIVETQYLRRGWLAVD